MRDISADRQSAVLKERFIAGVEGEEISLTVYFTKNGPRFVGLPFDIEVGGTATGIWNIYASLYTLCLFLFFHNYFYVS